MHLSSETLVAGYAARLLVAPDMQSDVVSARLKKGP